MYRVIKMYKKDPPDNPDPNRLRRWGALAGAVPGAILGAYGGHKLVKRMGPSGDPVLDNFMKADVALLGGSLGAIAGGEGTAAAGRRGKFGPLTKQSFLESDAFRRSRGFSWKKSTKADIDLLKKIKKQDPARFALLRKRNPNPATGLPEGDF